MKMPEKLILGGLVLLSVGANSGQPPADYELDDLHFPEGFIFAAATASYQVEGAWNVSGKGENIWDRITHSRPGWVNGGDTGDVACDSYHLYKEDVKNLKDIGFKMYRFSLSWSRLFPTGYISKVNTDGVRYYNELINELLANAIEPMVTIYHWDLPQPLQDIGGWLNPDMSHIFADYARAVFKLFGDRVKTWATINEPLSVTEGYGGDDTMAPDLVEKHGYGEYLAGHNLLRAHGEAYRVYQREFQPKQKGKVSIVLNGAFYLPANPSNPSDVKAAERANQFELGWFGHPVFSSSGDYPEEMKDAVARNSRAEGLNVSRLPTFSPQEIAEIRGSFDYFGLNHYSSWVVTDRVLPSTQKPSRLRDMGVTPSRVPGATSTECTWQEAYPEGFRAELNWLKKQYKNPEILITENGYCGKDELNDLERINYHKGCLKNLLAAIKEDGCRVFGYTVWSLMDNFEWKDGYSKKFGIMRTDFSSPQRTRTMKKSAYFFKQLLMKNYFSNDILVIR